MSTLASNLRRLMAQQNLTIADVVRRSSLDERTIKNMLAGRNDRPHARTLHKLAQGLGVAADELFQNPSLLARRTFDRQTNPLVDELVQERPRWFDHWSLADFDELYSHFGTGGELTREGAERVVQNINRKREVQEKVALLLETSEADILVGMVELLFNKVVVTSR